MEDKNLLTSISKKLDVLIYLAFLNSSERRPMGETIAKLSGFGLTNDEIAQIVGTTKRTVEVMKSRKKKGEGK